MGFAYEDDSGVVRTFSPREPSTVALSKLKLQNPSTTEYEDILLIHELLETVHTAAAVEALALGVKMGLRATDLVPIIANAAGSSESFSMMADKVVAGDFSTGKTITEGCTKLVSWFVFETSMPCILTYMHRRKSSLGPKNLDTPYTSPEQHYSYTS
jgi:3-hydroxyisobutyrate dehydrogenase